MYIVKWTRIIRLKNLDFTISERVSSVKWMLTNLHVFWMPPKQYFGSAIQFNSPRYNLQKSKIEIRTQCIRNRIALFVWLLTWLVRAIESPGVSARRPCVLVFANCNNLCCRPSITPGSKKSKIRATIKCTTQSETNIIQRQTNNNRWGHDELTGPRLPSISQLLSIPSDEFAAVFGALSRAGGTISFGLIKVTIDMPFQCSL